MEGPAVKQLAFFWFTFMAAICAVTTALIYADRATGGPNDQWWAPILTIGFFAGFLTAAVSAAKKDWS